MTNDHVTQLQELLAKGARSSPISSEAMESVLRSHSAELLRNFMYVLEEMAKMAIGFTLSRANMKVDHTKTAQEAIDTLVGMIQDIDPQALATMRGYDPATASPPDTIASGASNGDFSSETVLLRRPDEGDFHFLQIPENASDDTVMQMCASRGLRPADVHEVCALNRKNWDFIQRYPNVTIWQSEGVWYYLACHNHLGQYYVRSKPHSKPWRPGYWMVCVPL